MNTPKQAEEVPYWRQWLEKARSKARLTPKYDKVEALCEAIEQHEGYYAPCVAYPRGSRSWRNNNPGNVKYVGQIGAYPDAQGFAVFKTYDAGFDSLRTLILRGAQGKSKYYKPTTTLRTFISIFAPSWDNNNVDAYLNDVCRLTGFDPSMQLKDLLL